MAQALTPDDWRLVNQLFHHALDLEGQQREAFIDEKTRDLPAVRKELLSLLSSHSEVSEFLEAPLIPAHGLPADPLRDQSARFNGFDAGARTGDFLILRPLGQGAFATVYLAHQISLNRQVALKVSPNFGEEARTMAPLEHDNIVKVFSESVETERDLRLLCMQYIPGTTLERVLSKMTENAAAGGPTVGSGGARLLGVIDKLNTADASFVPAALRDRELLARYDMVEAIIWIGAQLADALAYAHERSVLHLDVKPGNVLLTPYGRPMLTDFNIAVQRAADGCSAIVLGGTLNYMAPEHRKLFDRSRRGYHAPENQSDAPTTAPIVSPALSIDPRADIYSLGVLLREMSEKAGVPLDEDHGLAKILERATEAEPDQRFESASAMRDALEGCLELRSIRRSLPPAGGLTRLVERYSLAAIAVLSVVPQIVGSIVNITYNDIFIVRNLTLAQQATFKDLVLLYNVVVYPLCLAWGAWELWPLRKCFHKPPALCGAAPQEIDGLRAKVLGLPMRVVTLFTLGWMPGSIFFTLAIHLLQGPLPGSAFGHFFISFAMSWLIALSYSCLYIQYVTIRVMYPRLWWGKRKIRVAANQELDRWSSTLRLFQFLAAFVPLIGAAMVVMAGPKGLSGHDYRLFQYLVTGLLGFGMLGLVFALKASQLLSAAIYAFTGRE